MYLRSLLFLILSCSVVFGYQDKVIVAGAFHVKQQAQNRSSTLAKKILLNRAALDIKNSGGFEVKTRKMGEYFCSTIEGFKSEKDMLKLRSIVRKIVPDAYIATSSEAQDESSKSTQMIAPTQESVSLEPADAHVEEIEMDADLQEGEYVEDVVDSVEETISQIETVIHDEGDGIDDQADSEVVPYDDVEVVEQEIKDEKSSSNTLWWILGVIGAIAAVVLFLFGRKKEKPASSREHLKIDLESTPKSDKQSDSVEPKSPSVEAKQEKPAEIVEEVVEQVEKQVEQAEEPVVAKSETSEPVTTSSRKKRVANITDKKITKENLKEFAGCRIIAADDNFINQKVLTKLFEGSGVELVIAENGQEVLDILEKDPTYEMVLMDAHMPVMDGFDSARHIRKDSRYEHVCVVALSGDTASDDLRKMREAGMEEQLAKPLDINDLYVVLYEYLSFDDGAIQEKTQETQGTRSQKSLDVAKGLEVCADDEGMYKEILQEFLDTYSNSAATTQEHLSNNNDIALVSLLLDLKGVGASIGADRFSEIAETFREAVLVHEPDKYSQLQDEFKEELDALAEEIRSYI